MLSLRLVLYKLQIVYHFGRYVGSKIKGDPSMTLPTSLAFSNMVLYYASIGLRELPHFGLIKKISPLPLNHHPTINVCDKIYGVEYPHCPYQWKRSLYASKLYIGLCEWSFRISTIYFSFTYHWCWK